MSAMSRERLRSVIQFLREQIWIILIFIVLSANAYVVYQLFLAPAPPAPAPPRVPEVKKEEAPAGMAASLLTGAYVPEADLGRRSIAVMIDNFAAARPSAGLNSAGIVWETLVEGGVTRFLAVYQTTSEVTIGPVRSARDYFLPWVKEVDAIYAHSGGSPAALAVIKADASLDDANEFSNGRAYYRVAGAAPHNLYTTTERLEKLRADKEWRAESVVTPLPATDEKLTEGDIAKKITINFSSVPAYRVQWLYDEEKDVYLRSQGGVVATDRETREQLVAKNLIVQFTRITPAPPPAPADAVVVETVGQGEAWFFRNGRIIKGQWEKTTATSRTVFFDADKKPYSIARGSLWIEVVPKEMMSKVKYE
ncbi:MAG: hypothetical protein UX68_C0010G0047 [Parcubacteria group bacterium GW2011_GWA2_46_9]|nr:MAG: hypothetical protein UX68_C0010G0047 [Parcubacteria group bacterium GW2011_GWA2_46_9]